MNPDQKALRFKVLVTIEAQRIGETQLLQYSERNVPLITRHYKYLDHYMYSASSTSTNIHKDFFHCHQYSTQTLHFGS